MRSFPPTCSWILLAFLLANGLQGAESKRWNIVLILVDDLGWTGLGCYGSDLHETPRIDELARRSLRFTSAYSAAPVCSPTRASIQTGKGPARLNMTVWLFFHYPHYYPTTSPVSAVRCGDWKLLEYHEDGRLELYNLAADLPESRNLAGERPGRSEELKRKLHAWRERVGAKMPRPNPDRRWR